MREHKLIAGNWKMNQTKAETSALLKELIPLVQKSANRVVVCVPYTDLETAIRETEGTNIHVGAQNVHWAPGGAYTGEISAEMLKELGVQYVIIGHSERRTYFGETNQTVMARLKAALQAGITPILCIGETLQQRISGEMQEVLWTQLQQGLREMTPEEVAKIVIAYEPVWAIGTGKTATTAEAEEAICFIRNVLKKLFGDVALDLPLLYGGSMNDTNAKELLSMPNIDGGLIGGASLKAEKFAKIVNVK